MTKLIYLLVWECKSGPNYTFDNSLEESESRANKIIKQYYPNSKDYQDPTDLGPYDSFSIYELPVPETTQIEDLNKIFNTVFINSHSMKLVFASS